MRVCIDLSIETLAMIKKHAVKERRSRKNLIEKTLVEFFH